MEVHDMFGAGERVVTRFTITGTHHGEFMGIAPTGRTVSIDGIAIDVVSGGVRVDGWGQLDLLGLREQLT